MTKSAPEYSRRFNEGGIHLTMRQMGFVDFFRLSPGTELEDRKNYEKVMLKLGYAHISKDTKPSGD